MLRRSESRCWGGGRVGSGDELTAVLIERHIKPVDMRTPRVQRRATNSSLAHKTLPSRKQRCSNGRGHLVDEHGERTKFKCAAFRCRAVGLARRVGRRQRCAVTVCGATLHRCWCGRGVPGTVTGQCP